RRKRPAVNDLLRILRDINEAAAADGSAFEFADVHVACRIYFGRAQKSLAQPAAVVPVKLGLLLDEGLRVEGHTKVCSTCGNTPNRTDLCCQRQQVGGAFLSCYGRDALGHTNTEIHDRTRLQL